MNHILFAIGLLITISVSAQEDLRSSGGIRFIEYPMQIESKKSDLETLMPPLAITDCEEEEGQMDITYEDVTFSGGKHGTLERTWTATDACGNRSTTVQYIALRE